MSNLPSNVGTSYDVMYVGEGMSSPILVTHRWCNTRDNTYFVPITSILHLYMPMATQVYQVCMPVSIRCILRGRESVPGGDECSGLASWYAACNMPAPTSKQWAMNEVKKRC